MRVRHSVRGCIVRIVVGGGSIMSCLLQIASDIVEFAIVDIEVRSTLKERHFKRKAGENSSKRGELVVEVSNTFRCGIYCKSDS